MISKVVESVWFMCQFCKICVDNYEKLINHVKTKHTNQSYVMFKIINKIHLNFFVIHYTLSLV